MAGKDWVNRQRADFILARLAAGRVIRKDLKTHFSVSEQTASAIFNRFQEEYVDAMVYDKSRKGYIPGPAFLRHYQRTAKTAAAETTEFD